MGDKDEFAQQDFLGFLRWNGKWHDFHGKDQGLVEGELGDELSLGQQGICEAKAEYVPEPNGIDKYCCRMCNDVVILDTHCMEDEGCDKEAEEPYASGAAERTVNAAALLTRNANITCGVMMVLPMHLKPVQRSRVATKKLTSKTNLVIKL